MKISAGFIGEGPQIDDRLHVAIGIGLEEKDPADRSARDSPCPSVETPSGSRSVALVIVAEYDTDLAGQARVNLQQFPQAEVVAGDDNLRGVSRACRVDRGCHQSDGESPE